MSCFAQEESEIQKRLTQLDKELSKEIGFKEPGLSVIITQNDKIVFEKYYGYADLQKNERLGSEHVLGIASMTKQFTGMVTLFLVEEGKLKLDDDIRKYFTNLPVGDKKITIKQLLSHTSGLPEITQNSEFMDNIAERHKINEIIDLAFKGPFTGEPGVRYKYCNTGYIIMAALIEKLSGQNYSSFLQNKIFGPLQMNNTYSCDYNQDADNAVQRYFPDSTGYVNATVMHFSNLIGGGAVVSNVRDMAKWGIALNSGDHLPRNYKTIWESNVLNTGEETGYGLGMGNNEHHGKSYYYHPGMGDGMNSVNLIFPDDKVSITVIRNMSSPKLNSVNVALMATEYLFDI